MGIFSFSCVGRSFEFVPSPNSPRPLPAFFSLSTCCCCQRWVSARLISYATGGSAGTAHTQGRNKCGWWCTRHQPQHALLSPVIFFDVLVIMTYALPPRSSRRLQQFSRQYIARNSCCALRNRRLDNLMAKHRAW